MLCQGNLDFFRCFYFVWVVVLHCDLPYEISSQQPESASVALLVASQYVLPGYGDRRVWFEAQAGRIIVSGYSGVCFEIKFSGRHRGFDGVLFNL